MLNVHGSHIRLIRDGEQVGGGWRGVGVEGTYE